MLRVRIGGERRLAGETGSHGVHTGVSKDAAKYVQASRRVLVLASAHMIFFFPRDASTSEIGVLLSTLPYPMLDPAANSYPGPPLLFFLPIIMTKPLLTFPRSFALLCSRKVSSESKTYNLSLHPQQSILDFPLGHMNASDRSKK